MLLFYVLSFWLIFREFPTVFRTSSLKSRAGVSKRDGAGVLGERSRMKTKESHLMGTNEDLLPFPSPPGAKAISSTVNLLP